MKALRNNSPACLRYEKGKLYIILLFQRTYSWKKSDNWKTLWDDLLSLYTSESTRKHFLGALVSMPVDMNSSGGK